jgi:hypothetical protein
MSDLRSNERTILTFIDASLGAMVRGERVVVILALIAVIASAWAYLLAGAGMGTSAFEMTRMSQLEMAEGIGGMGIMTPAVWTANYAILMFFMW